MSGADKPATRVDVIQTPDKLARQMRPKPCRVNAVPYLYAVAELEAARRTVREFEDARRDEFPARWERFESGAEPFELWELRFAESVRCSCGAGLAFPRFSRETNAAWQCADVLRGFHPHGTKAHSSRGFAVTNYRSEAHPHAKGTTRPHGGRFVTQ